MSPYSLRHRVCLCIGLVHLGLMALGASYIGYGWAGPAEPALDYYGELSGASFAYGFFAPGIDNQLRAEFEVTDKSGRMRLVPLETGASHEADLRVGDIIDQFSNQEDDTVTFQRSLSSSLAGTIFGREPEAEAVNVRLEEYRPVSMADYRGGKRATWETVYQAKYVVSKGVGR